MKLLPNLLAVAVLAAISTQAHAEIEFDVIGGSEVSFEGLLQADYYSYNNDIQNLGASNGDGVESDYDFRRAELVFKGKGPGQWNWVVGYDAKDKKFLDANIAYKFSGFTSLTVGQFKQPNSLEELSSTKNNDFIAKAMNTNTQGIARRTGVALTTGGDNWVATGSYFARELTRGRAAGTGFGARVAWAPIKDDNGFLHLGVSAVDYDANDNTQVIPGNFARIRSRPDADVTNGRLIDSGSILNADRYRTYGAEAAWVHGPFKLQGEYMGTTLTREQNAPDFKYNGWYVSGVFNLTGETWQWKTGTIATPLPNEPASGMWQVGIRYDKMDLNDGSLIPGVTPKVVGILGGQESNITVGVNYYWHSNFKFALNYVKVDSSRYIGKTSATYSLDPAFNNRTFNSVVDDNPNILEFRAQIFW